MDGNCTPGCQTNNDCPSAAQTCDPAAGPNGQCVECLSNDDCGQGAQCLSGACHQGCMVGWCMPPQVCRAADNVCVECLTRDQCGPGQLCDGATGTCVDSPVECFSDSDCQAAMVCTPAGICAAGCRVDPPSCPAGSYCGAAAGSDGMCIPGCQSASDCGGHGMTCASGVCASPCTFDGQCSLGAVCAEGACTAGCRLPARDCPRGYMCDAAASGTAGQCVAGCATNQDCGWFGVVCDPASRQCVECLQASDCNAGGAEATCSAEHLCVITCTPGQWDPCRMRAMTCDAASSTCQECTSADECGPGQACTSGRCTGPVQLALCDECQSDGECGGPADLCVGNNVGGRTEQVCGVDCSQGQACPLGTRCLPVGNQDVALRGYQCLPYRSLGLASCAARRDLVDQRSCQGSQACGLMGGSDDDAICSGAGGSEGHCSYFCAMGGTDCPEGFRCEDPPAANGQEYRPRCAPNP